jgi:hypothetical protein
MRDSDEYDSYVGGVYRVLASGASCEQVAEHLAGLERGPLGYPEATAARNMAAARKFSELNVRLWFSPRAGDGACSRISRGDAHKFHVLSGTPFLTTPYRYHFLLIRLVS